MNTTPTGFPNPKKGSVNRKWRSFAAGFLVGLICLGSGMIIVLNTNLRKQPKEAQAVVAAQSNIQNDLAVTSSTSVELRGKSSAGSRKRSARLAKEANGSFTQRTFTTPVWNAWVEAASDSTIFKPQRLQPTQDYSFVVNLAALHYNEDQSDKDAGVYSKDASTNFQKWVDSDVNKDLPSANVEVLIVPDRVHFRPQGDHEALKQMKIELSKMRETKLKGFFLSGSALKYLSSHGGEAPFSFGIKTFQVKTTDEVGIGYISVSIWKNDRPIGEIEYATCIVKKLTDPCNPPLVPESTFKGIDLRDSHQLPAAALHLIDRQSDIVGIFHCHDCSKDSEEYLSWEVPETVESFSRQVKAIIRRLGTIKPQHNGESNEEYAKRKQRDYLETSHASSEALYNLIFGSKKDSDGLKAKDAFIEFVRRSRRVEEMDKTLPPALFVRLIPNVPSLVLTPIGLLEVPPIGLTPDGASTETDYGPFTGFYLDIQTPLEIQDYSDSKECVSKWTLFVPPRNADGDLGAVEEARNNLSPWIEGFKSACGDCVMDDEDEIKFRHFLNGDGPDAGAVLVLSHHSDDFGLYFDESTYTPAILPSDIGRTFNENSIAILGACGTAEPGGSEFITKFNEMGVRSVIATTTAVEPSMTGRFLTLFLDSFSPTSESNTIGKARFLAARKLSLTEDSPGGALYGPRALVFILAGNAGRHLCVPPKGPQSVADQRKQN